MAHGFYKTIQEAETAALQHPGSEPVPTFPDDPEYKQGFFWTLGYKLKAISGREFIESIKRRYK